MKDSGAAAIEQLMRRRGRFDYILLETTGLADPGPIASIFWHNEDLSGEISLDGVVCVVDGVFGEKVSPNWGVGAFIDAFAAIRTRRPDWGVQFEPEVRSRHL